MSNRTIPRVNLLRAHGSPSRYLYTHNGCRCIACRAAESAYNAAYRAAHRGEAAAYRAQHREERLAYSVAYDAANREKKAAYRVARREEISAYNSGYHAAHREERASYNVAYKDEHRVELLAYRRTYNGAHREEKAVHNAAYRNEHHEELLAYSAAYRSVHREERAAWFRGRRSRERGNGGTHTAADVRAQYKRQRGRCYYCGVEVGDTYHVDHVVPISKGGSNDPSNLVVACAPCNLRKNDKLPHEFAGRLC